MNNLIYKTLWKEERKVEKISKQNNGFRNRISRLLRVISIAQISFFKYLPKIEILLKIGLVCDIMKEKGYILWKWANFTIIVNLSWVYICLCVRVCSFMVAFSLSIYAHTCTHKHIFTHDKFTIMEKFADFHKI